MPKKIIFALMLLLIVSNLAFAAEVSEEEKAARNLLDKITEMRYFFDAGPTKRQYQDKYPDLYIASRKFEDKYRSSPVFNEAYWAVGVYTDIADYWGESKGLDYTTYDTYYKQFYKYPGFKERLKSRTGAFTYKRDVLLTIYSYAEEYEKQFERKINDVYKK